MTETMPTDPGYYCLDKEIGWVKVDSLADMLLFRTNSYPPCECRIVVDPISDGII